MNGLPEMFAVRITVDADEGDGIVRRLVDALNEDGPHLARVAGVTWEKGYATMEFEPVSGDPHSGPTSSEGSMPGAEIVAALEGFSHEHSLVVPVVRALLTFSAARAAAGLEPRHLIRVDAAPAARLPQDVLSSHLPARPSHSTFGMETQR